MMKQKYLGVVLFALIIASGTTSLRSYRATEQLIENDMNQALTSALAQQQSNVITQDTIQTFNSHLQIAELRGKAIIAVDTKGRQFKAYARCSEATVFSLSDQRPTAILWTLTLLWAAFCVYRRRQDVMQLAGILEYGERRRNLLRLTGPAYQADAYAATVDGDVLQFGIAPVDKDGNM